jgi:hypothetical protein
VAVEERMGMRMKESEKYRNRWRVGGLESWRDREEKKGIGSYKYL